MKRFGKQYHMSWLELGLDRKFDWEGARNYCRRFCMDSVTFDSPREYKFFKGLIKGGMYQIVHQNDVSRKTFKIVQTVYILIHNLTQFSRRYSVHMDWWTKVQLQGL